MENEKRKSYDLLSAYEKVNVMFSRSFSKLTFFLIDSTLAFVAPSRLMFNAHMTPESTNDRTAAGVDLGDLTSRDLSPDSLYETQADRETDRIRVQALNAQLMAITPENIEEGAETAGSMLRSKRGERLVQCLANRTILDTPDHIVEACKGALVGHIPLKDRWPAG